MNPHRAGTRLTARWLIACVVCCHAGFAHAEDGYYRVPLTKLTLVDDTKLPSPATQPSEDGNWARRRAMLPYVVLDRDLDSRVAEAYVVGAPGGDLSGDEALTARAPKGQDLKGRLFLPKPDGSGMADIHFTISASSADGAAREPFLRARLAHYEQLMNRDLPGAAWFRHQIRETQRQLGNAVASDDNTGINFGTTRMPGELEDTYALFSGGRAVSESLQLDRVIPATNKAEDASVNLADLTGITVAEIDWKPLIKDLKPALDPLASVIPADQHAVFFPTFDSMIATLDEMDRRGTPLLAMAEARGEDARTADRYQRQLGTSMGILARLIGPQLVTSVAMTGSDPYLTTGSDLAVIFETKDGAALSKLLLAQLNGSMKGFASAEMVKGDVAGVAYEGARSTDRRLCGYVARLGNNAVVLTNSLVQLHNLVDAQQGKSPALASAPEYTYFRDRYKRGDASETALLILTDATIRRWCGPRWRIADSRRTRAEALMAELQAEHLDELAAGKIEAGPIHTDHLLPDAGQLRLTPAGVTSQTYSSLEFMTPIAELDLKTVTKSESDAYTRWRFGYQQNWRRYFDPIAARFTIVPNVKLAADVTVVPLIAGTDYRTIVDISRGAQLAPDPGDPHPEALAHFVYAINPKSPAMQGYGVLAKGLVGQAIDPLSWIGKSVALYADDDSFWADLVRAQKLDAFMHEAYYRIPIALRVESTSALKLTAFLTALHAFVDRSAPGMSTWEPLTHHDQPYVKISPGEQARAENKEFDKLAVYYSASGDALLITLSEDVLKRALDRQRTRRAAATAPAAARPASAPTTRPWLGASAGFRANDGLIPVIKRIASEDEPVMRQRAWDNLPILNEWHQRYPGQDPVQLQSRWWQSQLIDPAGGKYVWNEQWQTMESTTYGCPPAPKDGPSIPLSLENLHLADFGLSFEDQGLRARGTIEWKGK